MNVSTTIHARLVRLQNEGKYADLSLHGVATEAERALIAAGYRITKPGEHAKKFVHHAGGNTAGVSCEPLDLSNLLKHAFLSGVVAARNIPGHDECIGPALWADYDPTANPAYGRILSSLQERQANE